MKKSITSSQGLHNVSSSCEIKALQKFSLIFCQVLILQLPKLSITTAMIIDVFISYKV